ncbi:cation-translocating P-type ATPase [Hydrogenophaga luteola]|uniref:Cation-translocating P-type ATPase n=1 Tax=Hydrogenophaga luteola TaxID=1591122 RepID=A0ABV7W476_9BURK
MNSDNNAHGTDTGLTTAEAAQRLATDGPNVLPGGQRRSLLSIALDTAREPMFLLLLAAASLYMVFGDLREGLTLMAFVVITLGLTLYQEGKTERAIEALRDLTSPRALVVRDGTPQRIAGSEVVRGDLLQLSEGDRVPADALLVSADGLHADESLLTGEAVPVSKRPALPDELSAAPATAEGPGSPRPGGEDLPMVYAGTLIVQGHALARATATGARSEIGRIGTALGQVDNETSPLQKQTTRLVRNLALLALVLSMALMVVHGLVRGDWLQAVLAGIALAMAMLPEEYPVVMTVFPALGARRLSREGVLTRRINAIETLGATTVLCSDKTGTLTGNRMTVTHLAAGGVDLPDRLALDALAGAPLPEAFHTLVEFSILASVVDPFDPMEKAFHQLGERFLTDTEHLHRDWRLVQTYALSPALRAMSHVWAASDGGAQTVAAKGAPEAVMDLCHLDDAQRAHIAGVVDRLAAEGLRVLGVASGTFEGQDWPAGEHDFDFSFVGLLGLADPVRPQVPAAIAECRAAGIRVVMITGDYPATARAIAQQAGLAGPQAEVLSGDEMTTLSDAALSARMANVSVCARIAPEQKLRIVQALKARGDIVAMTGDGVNDAPALRAAHVGVAMGLRGTDVAREAASLVLVDDDFAAIVRAVRLGRRIFDNLRKAMSYILAVHVPIAGTALLPVLFGWPALLFPMHIALLELIIDPACSVAFENEPAEGDLMQRPPRDASAPLFGGVTLWLALLQGLGVLTAVLGAFAWAAPRLPEQEARAFAFATLVVGNLALILSNRSATEPFWATLGTPNRALWLVVVLTLALLLAALYVPWAVEVLRFAPLPWHELAAACGLGLLSVLWFETIKQVRRRRRNQA